MKHDSKLSTSTGLIAFTHFLLPLYPRSLYRATMRRHEPTRLAKDQWIWRFNLQTSRYSSKVV